MSKHGNLCFVTTLVDYPEQIANTTESVNTHLPNDVYTQSMNIYTYCNDILSLLRPLQHSRTFLVDDEPVKSVAFLAPAAQELCEASAVYWAHAGCPAAAAQGEQYMYKYMCCTSVKCFREDNILFIQANVRSVNWTKPV